MIELEADRIGLGRDDLVAVLFGVSPGQVTLNVPVAETFTDTLDNDASVSDGWLEALITDEQIDAASIAEGVAAMVAGNSFRVAKISPEAVHKHITPGAGEWNVVYLDPA